MPDFTQSRKMNVSADRVYEFISDVRNMPAYLPTTRHADSDGPGRVRVEGEVKGRTYNSDGYLRRVDDRHRVEWGSDEGDYSGFLEAREGEDTTEVTVHLHFGDDAWKSRGAEGPRADEVRRGIEKALLAIEQCLDRSRAGSQMTGNRNRQNIERL